jgi:DNA-binding Lrp family transcriptional regulator
MMVTAIVLLHVDRDRINPVAEQLAALPGVTEVYSVAGRYDLAAVIRTRTNEELAEVITTRIRQVGGIRDTETLIAFRAYSRVDLEAAFSLGKP